MKKIFGKKYFSLDEINHEIDCEIKYYTHATSISKKDINNTDYINSKKIECLKMLKSIFNTCY